MENIEQTLTQLEHDLSQVVIRRDAALLERLLDESYIFTNASGEVKNKAQTLAKFHALVNGVHFDFITNSDLRVQVYGEAAVITGAQAQQGSYNGQAISGTYRFTSMYVQRDGQWRCVAQHASSTAPIAEI